MHDKNRLRDSESAAAAQAAVLIASHHLPRDKAVETVMLSTGVRPSEAHIASELRRWFACFDPEGHKSLLLKKRLAALTVLTSLSEWSPALTGPVLAGDALEDDPVTIVIRTDDEKAVELALLAIGVEYDAVESSENGRSFKTVLHAECRGESILITITNSRQPAKSALQDEWQRPEEALPKLSEKGLRRLLGMD